MHIPAELYATIKQVMPIACVDLVVENPEGQILLVLRRNSPARGQWWFPGGRVRHGETRAAAAARKLREECGLTGKILREGATCDLMLEEPGCPVASHAITTLFHLRVAANAVATLDAQSAAGEWHLPQEWLSGNLDPFVRRHLAALTRARTC